ncbi:MAG: CehA/McbA family metallohydrolase [Anaerolineae bacterium]|nr:CehA/McbA family metallohydrolase [Anaerolineae bacterium]
MTIRLAPFTVPIDRPATLVVEGLTPGHRYVVRTRACRQDDDVHERELSADGGGQLCVEVACGVRGEHMLDLFPAPATDRLASLRFYAASPELRARYPLRCDFHIHTLYSDGRATPAEMLIRGRELGLDVAVITDHNAYQGSLDGLAARERFDLNLISMPGEEVSGPNWHTLAINADAGIADLPGALLGSGNSAAWTYEALRWAIEATQAHGGRAYLAHPYWYVERGFHLPVPMYDQVLVDGILDGIELLGDVRYQNNVRSLARYLDFRAAGHDIPILGNSDTHRTDHTYGTYWTLVYARAPTPGAVLDAIAEGWSVACTTVKPVDRVLRVRELQAFGSFDLVDYAYLLEEHFFPLHDALCDVEAALAYRAWRGERLDPRSMSEQRARMDDLYETQLGLEKGAVP